MATTFRILGVRFSLTFSSTSGNAFTGVVVSFAPIVPYTFSLFLSPLHAAFGWKREAIGGTFALAAITVALVSPGIGLLLGGFPTPAHYPAVDPDLRVGARVAEQTRSKHQAVLFHIFCAGAGRQWNCAVCVCAHRALVVSQTQNSRSRWFSPAVELAQS